MIAFINLCLLSLLLLNGYIYKKLSGTSINPVTIISYFWYFAAGIPIVFLLEAEVSPITILYIFFFIFFFSIPFYLYKKKIPNIKEYFLIHEICKSNNLLLFYFIIGIVSFSIHLQLNQLSYIEYLKSPLEVTAQNVANKYNEELNHSVFSQIAVILMYPNAFLAGVFYIFNEKFTKIKLLVYSFAVAILFFLIFGDKGPLFLVLFLFVTGLTLARKINNEKVLIKKEWIPKLLFVGLLLLVLIIIAFLSRSSGMEGNELSDFLLFSIRSYSLGHLHAFNDWLNYYSNNYSLYQYSVPNKPFGFYTFKSIYDILNIDVLVPLGTYDEYFNNGYLETNIYTVFRGLIYDFGILGSYLLSFLFGSLVCLGSEINNRCKKTISITMWFVFFTALYSSYGVSTFIWKTTIGSISIVFISFIFIEFKSIKQNKKINV